MQLAKSRIQCDLDFDRDGRQAGFLRAPNSTNSSGWGTVQIPIYVLKNGAGPTLLLTGGVHGDEYEGQIAIHKLSQSLKAEEICGRLIMIPAVNLPAATQHNGVRLSPIDGRDLNRCFPGNPAGTFCEMLAHFLDTNILPHVDVCVDMHTGGHSAEFAPCSVMHSIENPDLRRKTLAAAAAFGATFTAAIERRQILCIGTEIGGWGRVSVEALRIGERGLRNLLCHLGMLDGTPQTTQKNGASGTRHMMVPDPSCYSFATGAGIFEPCNSAGELVQKDQPAGYLHFVEELDRGPLEIRYQAPGLLWAAAGPGRVLRGDCVAVVMQDYEETPA
ncbi:MAG: peptidase M14 [Betaproteobacteria bacterium]|nr:peptidase M14 [Betaproteobacteria bacterium]